MIKEETQRRINITVVNYLNIVGIWKERKSDPTNPVVLYFMSNMMTPKSDNIVDSISGINNMEMDDLLNIRISNDYFHMMIKEFYQIYKKLDDIYNNQDETVKNILYSITNNEYDIENYIKTIFSQYKHSFYEILRYYNSKNEEYNEIKIKVLTDKMFIFAKNEEYEEAAELRDKIKELKEKGK